MATTGVLYHGLHDPRRRRDPDRAGAGGDRGLRHRAASSRWRRPSRSAGAVLTFFGFMHGEAVGFERDAVGGARLRDRRGLPLRLRPAGGAGRGRPRPRPAARSRRSEPAGMADWDAYIDAVAAAVGLPVDRGLAGRASPASSALAAEMAATLEAVELDDDHLDARRRSLVLPGGARDDRSDRTLGLGDRDRRRGLERGASVPWRSPRRRSRGSRGEPGARRLHRRHRRAGAARGRRGRRRPWRRAGRSGRSPACPSRSRTSSTSPACRPAPGRGSTASGRRRRPTRCWCGG